MGRLRWLCALVAAASVAGGCVSGTKLRADADVIAADIETARRNGAERCAPNDLATAEANLNFARGALDDGSSYRASDHVRAADEAVKRALTLTRDCRYRRSAAPVVVRIDEADRDGDGVPDAQDRCPDQPEDRDGFQDEDGCPDNDNDNDGVPDLQDRCPNTAGPLSNAGCPVPLNADRDGDGIPDAQDKCPDQPEDHDGFQDEDGCPDADNDGDGLADTVDRCPNEAGPVQNFGCPVHDRDGDGIPDNVDKCPDEPEDHDGFQDEDGCPDLDNDSDGLPDAQDKCPNAAGPLDTQGCPKQYKRVVVRKDRIEIKQQIRFKTNSAKIVGIDSIETLKEVAQALKDNVQIKRLRIEGHTDSIGNDEHNLSLSQSRANAVMAALMREGIDAARMQAVGYGESKPIASNATAKGRAENRRTEFNIVEQ